MTNNASNLNTGAYRAILVPSAILRFVLFAPLGFYWRYGTAHHNIIKNNIQLRDGVYSTAFAAGEKIAAKWGVFAFYWNFSVWIPLFLFPPLMSLPFTAVDIAITVYLSIATHYQNGYRPPGESACDPHRNDNFHDMQRPAQANESFFEAAARLNATVTTPQKMCESFFHEWQYGVALSFLYALITLLNIIAFLGSLVITKKSRRSPRAMMKELGLGILTILIHMPKMLLLLLFGIIYFLPEVVFRCLPLSLKAPVRQSRRVLIKTGVGVEQNVKMKMIGLKTKLRHVKFAKKQYLGGQGQPSQLSKFLGIYDMLMLVTQELHYHDIINLARVSQSVRHSVLPEHDFDRRLKVFKIYTCRDGPKACCWTCRVQTCSQCQQLPQIPQTRLLHHLDNCHPYCNSCYFTHISKYRQPPSQRLKSLRCRCAPATTHPNFIERYMGSSTYYAEAKEKMPKLARPVCRSCNLKSDVQLLEIKELEVKTRLEQARKSNGKQWRKCARVECKKKLGTGPRWWVCKQSTCGRECTSTLHQGWASGADERHSAVVDEHMV